MWRKWRERGGKQWKVEGRSLTAVLRGEITVAWPRVVAVWVVRRGHILDLLWRQT